MSESPSTSWVPAPGTVLDGRYRLDGEIGRGGMGVILRATHVQMGRTVAVKLLSPEVGREATYRARFRREVAVSATLDHPNIVRCYDFGETAEGTLYLVMELLQGRTLREALDAEGRFDLRRAAAISRQLLDGLAAAHLVGTVHRDLKPGNIFLVRDLRGEEIVKVLDFGLAKSLSSPDVRITRTGAICGTASYLPPEALITQDSTLAGDVYACGLIMLEMLIGRRVFASTLMAQTFLQQLMLPPQIPRRIWDTPFGSLIAHSLRKHPSQRPASAEEMYQRLGSFIGDLPDVFLAPDELPPPQYAVLGEVPLQMLAERKYRDLEPLLRLPEPVPWDPDGEPLDAGITERFIIGEWSAGAATQPDLTLPEQAWESEGATLRVVAVPDAGLGVASDAADQHVEPTTTATSASASTSAKWWAALLAVLAGVAATAAANLAPGGKDNSTEPAQSAIAPVATSTQGMDEAIPPPPLVVEPILDAEPRPDPGVATAAARAAVADGLSAGLDYRNDRGAGESTAPRRRTPKVKFDRVPTPSRSRDDSSADATESSGDRPDKFVPRVKKFERPPVPKENLDAMLDDLLRLPRE